MESTIVIYISSTTSSTYSTLDDLNSLPTHGISGTAHQPVDPLTPFVRRSSPELGSGRPTQTIT
ncbi:hypothetical protein Scep_018586 [Stephania cephalantha]|uniref:Uncharacterized protein n=1 Tax=Stephania cephalantha TaxID=152367 RepID=A0AAP0NK99_9MAGN